MHVDIGFWFKDSSSKQGSFGQGSLRFATVAGWGDRVVLVRAQGLFLLYWSLGPSALNCSHPSARTQLQHLDYEFGGDWQLS